VLEGILISVFVKFTRFFSGQIYSYNLDANKITSYIEKSEQESIFGTVPVSYEGLQLSPDSGSLVFFAQLCNGPHSSNYTVMKVNLLEQQIIFMTFI
jgi:hypothetical protein